MEQLSAGTCALVDSSALRHNLQQARFHAPTARVLAVIKANAYGHGLVRVAQALTDTAAGVDALAVARVKEGILLRQKGINTRIVVLQGFLSHDELDAHLRYQLEPVLHSSHQLQLLETHAHLQQLQAWIKLDTGMNRLGFQQAAWDYLSNWVAQHQQRLGGLTWMTHLANADDLQDTTTDQQLLLFRSFVGNRAEQQSIANSAGILGWKAAHGDWIRPGLMLYGVSPFAEKTGQQLGLRAVMSLHSRLISIKNLQAGHAVGYGGDWVCTTDTRIGVIAIGYGDGYPRAAQAGGCVYLHEQQLPIIGRISMDMLAVDLSKCIRAQVGDIVELWGENLAVESVAQHADTIPYTLLCNITRRVNIIDVQNSEQLSVHAAGE